MCLSTFESICSFFYDCCLTNLLVNRPPNIRINCWNWHFSYYCSAFRRLQLISTSFVSFSALLCFYDRLPMKKHRKTSNNIPLVDNIIETHFFFFICTHRIQPERIHQLLIVMRLFHSRSVCPKMILPVLKIYMRPAF